MALHNNTSLTSNASSYKYPFLFAIFATFCVLYVLVSGQDIKWDQQNYHIYTAYSLFNHRLNYDIAPAQLQTWFNPLGSLLQYILVMHASPRLASAVIALSAAPAIVLVYAIAESTFAPLRQTSKWSAVVLCMLSAVGAATGPLFLSELGGTMNDTLVADCVLGAICIYLRRRDSGRGLMAAGALFGLAVGLKLTASIYVVGFGCACLLDDVKSAPRRILLGGIGFTASCLIFVFPWLIYVYSIVGNPIFPLYNNIFKSPGYDFEHMLDLRLVAHSFFDIWRLISGSADGSHPTAELVFRDPRPLMATILFGLSMPLLLLPKKWTCSAPQDHPITDRANVRFLLFLVAITYVYWALQFGIERYIITLEQLGVLCILIAIATLIQDRLRTLMVGSIAFALVMITTKPCNWGRLPFTDSWMDISVPSTLAEPDTLFVMITHDPISYVIPFLPSSSRFVRVEGNIAIKPRHSLGQKILGIIKEHAGDIRTLSSKDKVSAASREALQQFGLSVEEGDCLPIPNKIGPIFSCKLVRSSQVSLLSQ